MVRATSNSRPFPAIAPHSNQSLLGAVSVAGKRNFEARDKGAEMAVGIHLASRRDQAPARKPANSGLFAKTGEISVRHGLRGGPGRTRTSNQAVMSALPYPERSIKIGISAHVRQRLFTFGNVVTLVVYWLGSARPRPQPTVARRRTRHLKLMAFQ
jgi:hypothetical protein